ncbi:MAG: carboxypeptidase regulatory-like domain-containing protein, partial [Bacteroidales bacterium]|nr:carboxypeptidase regulatory-like domain-containing protein [Bacteroidales bacterium]
ETTYDQLAIRAKVFGPLFGDQILAPTTIPVSGTTIADNVESVNTAPMALESGEVKLGGSEYLLPDGRSRFTLMGYNVYKDDVVLNGTVLTANMYVDVCSPGGIYYYNVTAVYDMGESCPIDPPYEAIVGEEFPPPTDLTGQALEGDDVLLTWNEPGEATGQWIHWDDGENYTSIGLTSGGTFLVASRWGTADLVPFDGMYLTKVSLFPTSDGGTSYALKVWTGENAGTLVVDMPLSNLIMNAWNTITLTDPVLVDATQELWFGYENIDQPAGEHPAGCDDGPAVAGYGDMISMDGATWDPISGFGLDYNWNLQGYVASEADYAPLAPLAQELIINTGDVYLDAVRNEFTEASVFSGDDSRQTLLGYNLWKNGDNFIYVPAPDTFYIDPAVVPGTYEYYVSAVYAEGESFWDGPAVVVIIARGDLGGEVYDIETMDPIEGATVIVDPGGFTVITGADGNYMFYDLETGYYDVTADADDYNPTTMFNVEVLHNQETTVDLGLISDSAMHPIPFYEPWDAGSFEAQYWSFDPGAGNWLMDTGFGNPAPSAEFNWSPSITDYSFALVSVGLDARYITTNVTLEFDLYLSDYSGTGAELMTVDVWDGTSWIMVDEFANLGDINWDHMTYDVSQYAFGIITKVRFVAHGADSWDINNWDIDNIQVHEVIMATVMGTVTNLDTGDPIEGAMVEIGDYDPVYTGADGTYTKDVVEAEYDITCSAAGYLTAEVTEVIVGVKVVNFALEPEPCNPPFNLVAEVAFPIFTDVQLTWDSPGGGTIDDWLHYDDGIQYNNIGLTEGGSWMVAVRFEPSQLAPYMGTILTEISLFPMGFNTTYVLKVWTGANAANLIVDQPMNDLVIGQWNTVILDTPVPINISQELWFGYALVDQAIGDYPAGCDAGPAVPGYGDMITLDGVTWETLSGYGLNYNWNLQGHVVSLDGEAVALTPLTKTTFENSRNSGLTAGDVNTSLSIVTTMDDRALLGYNVYRDNVQINDDLVYMTSYLDTDLELGTTYDYCVTAVYTLCESECSNVYTITLTGLDELENMFINVYPVPAKEFVNIEVSQDIREFRIMNYIGQVVYEHNFAEGEAVTQVNTASYRAGTYLVEFISQDGGIAHKQIIITK